MQKAKNTDVLLELYKNEGAKVSKLGPLDSDVIEISRNKDFIAGIEEAIEKIESYENKQDKPLSADYVDIARYRLMGF